MKFKWAIVVVRWTIKIDDGFTMIAGALVCHLYSVVAVEMKIISFHLKVVLIFVPVSKVFACRVLLKCWLNRKKKCNSLREA